ncbi:hypothetical protein V9T40_003466 [Parthenolecanium corni]|uniref:Uncharacterized protein n=1 Tax=Parthenolecanium corni TaxID=536013 RepID=A0AAN9YA64_9HEMI
MFRVLLLEEEKLANAKNISYDVDGNSDTIDFGNHILKDSGGELGEIYIAVVYPKSKETLFNRVIKQTMTSLSEDFAAATNLRIVPFYTVIGDTDGYSVLDVQKACEAWNHKPIVAALVFSSFRSGFAHVLTSLHNNIPVLWATGEVQAGYFERVPLSRFEIRLDPGSYEVLRSLRSLALATHWHAFTIMHTTISLASKVYKDIIDQRPLLPTILQFQPDSSSNYIFRIMVACSAAAPAQFNELPRNSS